MSLGRSGIFVSPEFWSLSTNFIIIQFNINAFNIFLIHLLCLNNTYYLNIQYI